MEKGGALLIELVAVFTAAALLGVPLARLKVPPVLAYLVVGVLLGPNVTGFVVSQEAVSGLAEIGVALLLLGVGLEFGSDKLRRLARPMAVAGGIQLVGTLAAGVLAGTLAGLDPAGAFAVGGILALSSTAVVLRLLQDKGLSARPEGLAVTAILVLQDMAVVPLVLVVDALGTGGSALEIGWALLRAAVVLALAWLGVRVLAHRILDAVARLASAELFLLTVLAIAGLVALACTLAGLSPALGAFLAGVVLADGNFAHRATREILPLRAVTACIFFASVGMLLDPATLWAAPGLVVAAVVGIAVVKALIAALGARASGLTWPAALTAGLLLAQVGEFSFVLAGVGIAAGVLEDTMASNLAAVTVASMGATALGSTLLGRRGRRRGRSGSRMDAEVIIAGYGVGGRTALDAARGAGRRAAVVERNAETVARLTAEGVPALLGDATDTEVLERAGMDDGRTLVVAISDLGAAYAAARRAHARWPEARTVLRVRFEEDTLVDLPAGIEVICEEVEGARALARRLVDGPGAP